MSTRQHRCPVCHKVVTRTQNHNICGHYDKAKQVCPASFLPFSYAIVDDPEPQGHQ